MEEKTKVRIECLENGDLELWVRAKVIGRMLGGANGKCYACILAFLPLEPLDDPYAGSLMSGALKIKNCCEKTFSKLLSF